MPNNIFPNLREKKPIFSGVNPMRYLTSKTLRRQQAIRNKNVNVSRNALRNTSLQAYKATRRRRVRKN